MKVILLTDVPKVGNRYDVKDLKEGYAQNVLISKGLAVLATSAELAKLDQRKKEMDKKKDEEAKIFNELIASVNNKKIVLKVKANEKGHLFKSVSARDIKEAIKENSKIEIDEKTIIMDHIKELGVYSISIKRGDKVGKCEVIVEAL